MSERTRRGTESVFATLKVTKIHIPKVWISIMNREIEAELFEKYPALFSGRLDRTSPIACGCISNLERESLETAMALLRPEEYPSHKSAYDSICSLLGRLSPPTSTSDD